MVIKRSNDMIFYNNKKDNQISKTYMCTYKELFKQILLKDTKDN